MYDIEMIIVIVDASIWLSMSISFVNMIKELQSFMIWSWVIIAISDELTMIMIESFWRADDDYDRKFLSENHEKEDSELQTIKIFVENCSIFDFQLL
jgi:hypothetical protein